MVDEIEYSALKLENLLSRRDAGETNPLESAGA